MKIYEKQTKQQSIEEKRQYLLNAIQNGQVTDEQIEDMFTLTSYQQNSEDFVRYVPKVVITTEINLPYDRRVMEAQAAAMQIISGKSC